MPTPPIDARTLLAHLPVYIVILSKAGIVEYINRAMPGREPKDMIGRSGERLLGSAWPRYLAAIRRSLRTRQRQTIELSAVDGLGRSGRYRVALSPLPSAGKPERVLAVSIELTEAQTPQPTQAAVAGAGRLTPREREVLALVAQGFSSRTIARDLKISARTVESHREHMANKLNLRGTAALTRFALAAGLAPL